MNRLFDYLPLIFYRGVADIRAEASRSYLGILWWVIEPSLYLAAFYLIFALGFRGGGGVDYVAFLLSGLILWKWFHSSVSGGCYSISSNQGLVNQVYIPKFVLPLTVVVSGFFKFLFILTLFFTLMLLLGFEPSIVWAAVPVLMVAQILIATGIGMLGAVVVSFVSDFRLVIDNGLMMLFFMSGIFFDISERSEEAQRILYLNPVAVLIREFRRIVLDAEWPNWSDLALVGLEGVAFILVGSMLLRKFDRIIPKVVV